MDMAHRAFGLYVHITWHTRLRQRSVRLADADLVRAAIHEAAARCEIHVHDVAVLSDHVHIIASFRPEGGLVAFIRHAKSESARRINLDRGAVFQWGCGLLHRRGRRCRARVHQLFRDGLHPEVERRKFAALPPDELPGGTA